MTDGLSVMRACARWTVAGGSAPALGELDDETWVGALHVARLNRLVGVLAAAVAHSDLDGPRREQAADLEAEWAMHTVRAEQAMLKVVEMLDGAGIPVRALKGSAYAHRYWPAPEMRVFGDADVLVPSRYLDDTVRMLLDAGGERILPQVRPGFDRRFGKSVTVRNADRVEIDLHRALVAGPHTFLVPEDDLWVEPSPVSVAGRSVPCFPPEMQLVHAATHAVASRASRLGSVLDMAFTGRRADLQVAGEIAARWKLRAVVREAGARLSEVLGTDGGTVIGWAASLRPTAEEERLHELFSGQVSFRRSAFAATGYISPRRDRVRFLAALAFPSKEHRRTR